ncbi:MAG: hypothetical protein A2020_04915 [Lentisphaerae bacterium GWF2_45_14]|nr:MAG: hypothetical protein A2020_04915 [Lentisphaerae bacterium GWF2_45_14]
MEISLLKKSLLKGLLVCFLAFMVSALSAESAKYIFLMIGDGMGVNQRKATEKYLNASGKGLVMEKFPYSGLTVTDSLSGVTDSAAGGTAIACGFKTKNGMLGILPDGKHLQSIAEYAKDKGMKIGIITSDHINGATPAAFYAHADARKRYSETASFMPQSEFDFFAGNKILTDKQENDSTRALAEKGYKIIRDFKDLNVSEKGKSFLITSMPLAIDEKNNDGVRLKDILGKAIEILDNEKGFFIMLEGAKIDWSGHNNDLASGAKELVDFDNAVKTAYEFYQKNPSDTLIVVTADHETGGLQLSDNISKLPDSVNSQKCSKLTMHAVLEKYKKEKKSFEDVLKKLEEFFDLKDLNDSEMTSVRQAYNIYMDNKVEDKRPEEVKKMYGNKNPLIYVCSKMADEKGGYKWTLPNHSMAKVKTSAVGVGAELFNQEMDNTQIPANIKKIMK